MSNTRNSLKMGYHKMGSKVNNRRSVRDLSHERRHVPSFGTVDAPSANCPVDVVLTRDRTVLSARWGLGLLRQWAADDSVFKALESPTSNDENDRQRYGRVHRVNVNEARMLSRQHCNRNNSKGRSSQASTRRTRPWHEAEQGVATTPDSTDDFTSEGRLRLSSPAGESALSLAWTNSRDAQISIHLFTPGAVEQRGAFLGGVFRQIMFADANSRQWAGPRTLCRSRSRRRKPPLLV